MSKDVPVVTSYKPVIYLDGSEMPQTDIIGFVGDAITANVNGSEGEIEFTVTEGSGGDSDQSQYIVDFTCGSNVSNNGLVALDWYTNRIYRPYNQAMEYQQEMVGVALSGGVPGDVISVGVEGYIRFKSAGGYEIGKQYFLGDTGYPSLTYSPIKVGRAISAEHILLNNLEVITEENYDQTTPRINESFESITAFDQTSIASGCVIQSSSYFVSDLINLNDGWGRRFPHCVMFQPDGNSGSGTSAFDLVLPDYTMLPFPGDKVSFRIRSTDPTAPSVDTVRVLLNNVVIMSHPSLTITEDWQRVIFTVGPNPLFKTGDIVTFAVDIADNATNDSIIIDDIVIGPSY